MQCGQNVHLWNFKLVDASRNQKVNVWTSTGTTAQNTCLVNSVLLAYVAFYDDVTFTFTGPQSL
jgi:hypothetical protein